MPELPEVETVRRGLQPAMEGARFVRVEQRRPDLRFPFPKNFNKRLEGASVEGLNRRAKYLLVDLSSGEVLLMHLGMSGSWRVLHGSDEKGPGKFHHARGKLSAHDHVVFHMSNGAIVTFNDPRRFGYMKLIARDAAGARPDDRAARPRAARQCVRRRDAGGGLRWQEDLAQGGAVGPARGGGPRQHLCVRGAAPRASLAQAHRLDDRDPTRRERTRARMRSPNRSARCSTMRSAPAAPRCATIAAPTASSATSSTISGSTIARARSARRRAARARSSASCRGRGARSFVRCVRSSSAHPEERAQRASRRMAQARCHGHPSRRASRSSG